MAWNGFSLCWRRCSCRLRPYTAEEAEIITYPVRVRDGITAVIRDEEVSSETLSEARARSRTETEITLDWAGGNSCTLPLSDVLIPDPEKVSRAAAPAGDWAALFAP